MYTAIAVPGGENSVAIVRVAVPFTNVQTAITQLQTTLIGTTIMVAFVAVLLAIIIAARTTRPILELTLAVQELATHVTDRNSPPRRIVPSTLDEVGQLSTAFNLMASQVNTQIDALMAESSKLNAVLDQMTDGVVIADDQGRVKMINPAAERMFRVDSNKAIGRSLAEVLRHYQLVEIWQTCRNTGELQAGILEINLERIYLQAVATPLGEALPGSILLLLQDLTQLRRLETIRRDFISNISHELRTPLASLKALAETLQEHALDDPQAARRFLQRMEIEVDALSLMVLELLELSRIESGKVPLAFEAVSPVEILESARDRLHLQAERANLSVDIDCPGDLPNISVDPPRIEQVVVNLLHNAIKFTAEGGQVTLSARMHGPAKNQIIVSVQDTGVGIPVEDMPRIFERFFKADRSRSGGGTGLGLAIAKHLVEAHNGHIWAESQEGKGSIFSFTLPIDRGFDDKEN
jgi:two-component system phosphate regulon sensor histidine kinase PhoR